MSVHGKLALLAAGLVASWAVEAQAAPMLETQFVNYIQNGMRGGTGNNAGYLMFFVNWRQDSPKWTAKNIQWVEAVSSNSSTLPVGTNNVLPPWVDQNDNRIRDKHETIPEPAAAGLMAAAMGLMALRRRRA